MHYFDVKFPAEYEDAEEDLIDLNNYAQARRLLRQMYATKEEADFIGDELDFDDDDIETLWDLLYHLDCDDEVEVCIIDAENRVMDPPTEPELPIPDNLKKYGDEIDVLFPELLLPPTGWLKEGKTYMDWYKLKAYDSRWIYGLSDSPCELHCESDEGEAQPWDNDQFMYAVKLVVSKHPEITKDNPVTISYEVNDRYGREGFIQKVWYDEEKKGAESELTYY